MSKAASGAAAGEPRNVGRTMAQFNTFYIPMMDDGAMAERLNVFLRSHRILSVKQRDFPEGWGFCVEWFDGVSNQSSHWENVPYHREKVDYMKVLSPEEFKRFSDYRKRRKEIADTDGVKPFVIMTDAQMAELSKIDNPTKSTLKKIDGFGEARIEKYGDRILLRSESTDNNEISKTGTDSIKEGDGLLL